MDREEGLRLLLQDLEAFNERRGADPRGPLDLSGADLTGANLQRANLGDANLRGATLFGANLTKALLNSADLQGADLRETDLTDAPLHRADLRGADLRGAKVGGFLGNGRICLHPNCFEGALYDKAQLEEILEVLNRNGSWHIKYEIVPKG